MRAHSVYRIVNLATGSCYVGGTVDYRRRVISHRSQLNKGKHHAKMLQADWDRYGAMTFSFEVLETGIDPIFAEAREQFWMWRHDDAAIQSYNAAPVRRSSLGVRRSDEFRKKCSEAKRGMTFSPEHKAALRRGVAAKSASECVDWRREVADALRGRKQSEASNAKRSAAARGKPKSQEARQKMSAAKLGKSHSPEHVANWYESRWGRRRATPIQFKSRRKT